MAVDLRQGKKDRFIRYKVFERDYDYKSAIVSKTESKQIFYGKDVGAYSTNLNAINNRFARSNTTAQIETYDMINLDVGCVLYNMNYRTWWIVESFTDESVNETEQCSTRPSSRKVITIRKGQ